MKPLVSIIIPVFNRFDLLVETLESILLQTYTTWECLLVDDHSTDDTFQLLQVYCQRDKRFIPMRRPDDRQKGACACRNFGWEQSSGDLIQWFDSDDIMNPDMLFRKVQLLITEEVDFVVNKVVYFDSTGNLEQQKYSLESNHILADFISNKLRFYTPGPMFKRSFLIKQEKLFNERLTKHQEVEFFFRLLLAHPRYKTIDDSLIKVRKHENSIQGAFDRRDFKSKAKTNIDYYLLCLNHYWSSGKKDDPFFERVCIEIIRQQANHSGSIGLLNNTYKAFINLGILRKHPYLFRSYFRDYLRVIRKKYLWGLSKYDIIHQS